MDEQPEDPVIRARQLRAFRWATPMGMAVAYIAAWMQGAEPRIALMMAGIIFVGCVGAAGLIYLRGSKAGKDMVWIALIIRLFARR